METSTFVIASAQRIGRFLSPSPEFLRRLMHRLGSLLGAKSCPTKEQADFKRQSVRSKLDHRSGRVSCSLAAIPAIPANSHRALASAFQYWHCPPASGESPPIATTPAYGHVLCPPARWRL